MPNSRNKRIAQVTVWGMIVNLLLTAVKLVAGFFGKSAAMIADGIHSLSDLLSDFVVLFFCNISSRKKDKNHHFGHGKFETFATLLISILLLVVGSKMLAGAIGQINDVIKGRPLALPNSYVLLAALLSIVLKEILYRVSYKVAVEECSPALEANAWHHRSDALSSIAVFIGIGAALLLGEKWAVLDPIASAIISIAIIYVAINMGYPSIKELLDTSLPEDVEKNILVIANSVEGVRNVHNLKTRRNGMSYIIDMHIMVAPDLSITEAHHIATNVEIALYATYGEETQVSTHIEPDTPESLLN